MSTLEAARFGAETTTSEVIRGVDLTGKLAVITGGGGGLGLETARTLALAGADIVIGGRSPENIDAARDALATAYPKSKAQAFVLDLASVASVDAFADAVLALDRSIDLFIANAGIMASPLARNEAGHELQFATNFIGHAVLTSRLAPAIRKAVRPRVVILSSTGHHFSSIRLNDLNFETTPYDKWRAYGQSKTACSLLALKAWREMGVTALAVHPGTIGTGLMRFLSQQDYADLQTRTDVRPPIGRKPKTLAQGAATTVWAATAPELEGRFAYLEDCHVAEPVEKPDLIAGVLPYAVDPELADELWAATEELLGRKLSL